MGLLSKLFGESKEDKALKEAMDTYGRFESEM